MLFSANILRNRENVTLSNTDAFVLADYDRQQAWSSGSGQEAATVCSVFSVTK